MPTPSASARRSAQASRFRMQGAQVRVPDKKLSGFGRLSAVISGATTYGVSLMRSLFRQHKH